MISSQEMTPLQLSQFLINTLLTRSLDDWKLTRLFTATLCLVLSFVLSGISAESLSAATAQWRRWSRWRKSLPRCSNGGKYTFGLKSNSFGSYEQQRRGFEGHKKVKLRVILILRYFIINSGFIFTFNAFNVRF